MLARCRTRRRIWAATGILLTPPMPRYRLCIPIRGPKGPYILCRLGSAHHCSRDMKGLTPKCSQILWKRQNAIPWPETRVLSYRLCRSVKKCDLGARNSKQKKRLTDVQVTYLPRPLTLRYPHQSCYVARDVVTHAKFHRNWFNGFGFLRG